MSLPVDLRYVFASLFILVVFGVMASSPMPFIVDGEIYIDMVEAMSSGGSLAVASNGGIDGAPALTKYLTRENGGLVYPQYPSGYAMIAAPFYMLMGIRGLILMNGLAFLGSAFLVFHIAMRLYQNQFVSFVSLGIFVGTTFVTNYVTAIWPHMLSLLVWLGAIACTITAAGMMNANRRLLMFIASGLIIGIGINIRVDSILIYAVLFFWLRIFSQPSDRLAPLWLSIGLVPGLILAAWLNGLKFGTFTPLSYGSSGGATQLSGYYNAMIAAGVGFAALWLVNVPRLVSTVYRHFGLRNLLLFAAAAACIVLFFVGGFIFDTLYGVYVLVFNLQAHNAYSQAGVELNEYGHLLFWGYPKKALIQSLPYLPLILIPAFYFFRGKNTKAISVCLLAIAAPIFFYAMNQWHGGGSYNMRYFIPALPFIAILSAVALHELSNSAGSVSRPILLFACVSAAALFVGTQGLGQAVPALFVPAALYPQWVIAFLCTILIGIFLRTKDQNIAKATLVVSSFALTYSALLSLENESSHEKARAKLYGHAREIGVALPQNALVLTTLPVLTMHAQHKGTSVMVPLETNIDAVIRAAGAFEEVGRCVYFHNPIVTDLLAPHMPDGVIDQTPLWAGREDFPGEPQLAFFTLSSQTERCGF